MKYLISLLTLLALGCSDKWDEVPELDCSNSIYSETNIEPGTITYKMESVDIVKASFAGHDTRTETDSIRTFIIGMEWESGLSVIEFVRATQTSIPVSEAYAMLEPGEVAFRSGKGEGVNIRLHAGAYKTFVYESKNGNNLGSHFTILSRSAIYEIEGNYFTDITGNFCCYLYDTKAQQSHPRAVGNFSGTVKLN